MPIIYFFYGLSFGGLGLAALLQYRRGGTFPLHRQLSWLSAFGFAYAGVGWIDMFLASGMSADVVSILKILRVILQPLSGLLLLRFGWGVLTKMTPLPGWTRIIPGVVSVPLAFVMIYAMTTFVTPSPIDIPIDIWSRYLLYLPGSIMASIGFIRQRNELRAKGLNDVSRLMFGAGLAFLTEALVVGLVVPAAPYGPVSYYNYDRSLVNAVPADQVANTKPFSVIAWLDYDRVLEVTGLPVQFWRMISASAVIFFVVRGLGVFDAMERRRVEKLQLERDRAQLTAQQVAESWTDALVTISRRIAELDLLDTVLLDIVRNAQVLLHSDFVAIGLLEDGEQQLALYAYADAAGAISLPANQRPSIENALIIAAIHEALPARFDAFDSPIAAEGMCLCETRNVEVAAVLPLVLDNYPVGALWSVRFTPTLFTNTDMIGLERLADQAVIAIQHRLMATKLQSLAVVDERGRIAREMHDGLAQILGYMNLQVQALDALLKQGEYDKLSAELQQMRDAVQVAHADVRENILSLRTTLATDAGVASAIADYLDGFSVQTGIDVRFIDQSADGLGLSPLAEVQLVCILQEALTNVRKHARAENVTVTLARTPKGASLEVVDDGAGFAGTVAKHRFGLHTMLERAESVGGQLVIRSQVGQGTKVFCELPEVGDGRETSGALSVFRENAEIRA